MGKKDLLKDQLMPILSSIDELERYMTENSNLPGRRANLELAFALADIFDDTATLLRWIEISEDQADVNDPRSFLPFCAVTCLGRIFTKNNDETIISILKRQANDGRWRMREAVAFAFQFIGEDNFSYLIDIFSDWLPHSNNLEKRAILVSLAHPTFLNPERAIFCFQITDAIFTTMNTDENFDILKKGLEFTISVFLAANLKKGLKFIDGWIGKNEMVDRIIKVNLKKNRIEKMNSTEVKRILEQL